MNLNLLSRDGTVVVDRTLIDAGIMILWSQGMICYFLHPKHIAKEGMTIVKLLWVIGFGIVIGDGDDNR